MSLPESRLKLLLVDGHSIIFTWDDLRGLHRQNTSMAREELIRRMTQYQDGSGEQVVLVFDGKGARTTSNRETPDGLQVIYSARDQTADGVIERITASHSESYEITVATADGAERETVMAFGGFCISPLSLRERLDRIDAQLNQSIRRLEQKWE